MGLNETNMFRCLLVEKDQGKRAWFERVVSISFADETRARVDVTFADHASQAFDIVEASEASSPIDLLFISKVDLEGNGQTCLGKIRQLLDRHLNLCICMLTNQAAELGKEDEIQITINLPSTFTLLRNPLCANELQQMLRLRFELWHQHSTANWRAMQQNNNVKLAPENAQIFLLALMENLPVAVYFKDLDSRFLSVSTVLARWFNLEAWEMVGKTDQDLQSPEIYTRARAEELQIIKTGQPIHGLCEQITLASGSKKWIMTSKAPLCDVNGEIIGTLGVSTDISGLKQAEDERKKMQSRLVEVSREAGMAEVATGVLHNVGNVLNSVMTSMSSMHEILRNTRMSDLDQAVSLMASHRNDLSGFLSEEGRAGQLFEFIQALNSCLSKEHDQLLNELKQTQEHIQHICQIVAMQQSYAKVVGVQEIVAIDDVLQQAIMINSAGLERHGVVLEGDLAALPKVMTDRHKLLQILVNLISNAKYACDATRDSDRRIWIRGVLDQDHMLRIEVQDNGIGIGQEHMEKIFTHGFTTKADGHGFGLHNSSLTAKELGGRLEAKSHGSGLGATFTLWLPVENALKEAA